MNIPGCTHPSSCRTADAGTRRSWETDQASTDRVWSRWLWRSSFGSFPMPISIGQVPSFAPLSQPLIITSMTTSHDQRISGSLPILTGMNLKEHREN